MKDKTGGVRESSPLRHCKLSLNKELPVQRCEGEGSVFPWIASDVVWTDSCVKQLDTG